MKQRSNTADGGLEQERKTASRNFKSCTSVATSASSMKIKCFFFEKFHKDLLLVSKQAEPNYFRRSHHTSDVLKRKIFRLFLECKRVIETGILEITSLIRRLLSF